MYHSSREFSEVSILLEREVNEMKKISWKDFLVGVLATTIVFILLGAATTDDGPGRYAVSVGGGGGNNYSVCVTDTYTCNASAQFGVQPVTYPTYTWFRASHFFWNTNYIYGFS